MLLSRHRLLVLALVPLWTGALLWVDVVAARQPAPVVEGVSAAGRPTATQAAELEARVVRLEQVLKNDTLVDMLTRIEALQGELQTVLGQVEVQGHELETLKKRQRDLYLDVDNRLRRLEQTAGAPVAAAPTPPPLTSVPAEVPVPAAMPGNVAPAQGVQGEREAYESAFALLKEGRYEQAVSAFRSFQQNYPGGAYADNAQYWLGEANYVQRQFQTALQDFTRVVRDFPNSPKRADAMLKIAFTYQELGDRARAIETLNEVVSKYPNSTAATLASRRLQDLKQAQ